MNAPTHRQPSGIALIIVMIAITVLTMLTVAFAFTMKVETKLAQNSNSFEHLRAGGWSGGQAGCWMLSSQALEGNEPYDGLDQKWAGGSGDDGDSNSVLANVTMPFVVILHDGDKVTLVKIVDLERYVNINTASEAQLRLAFNLMGVEDADTQISSILDWVSPGENQRPNGAKSDYYQGLPQPYYCKDGPIDDLSELIHVKGITPEMYSPDARRAAFQGLPEGGGLSEKPPCYLVDMFTPLSTGKVNVNTASELVLDLIPGFGDNTNIAGGIISLRSQAPLLNIGELINVPGMTPAILAEASPYIDVHSHTFEVISTAEWGGYKQEFTTIVGRFDAQHINVLSFSWKDAEAQAASPPQ